MAAAASEHDLLDESKLRYVDVDGVRTRYYEDGAGDPLILLHGGHFGFLDSLDTWSLNLNDLSRSFHVYAVDKGGQGYTGNPSRDEDYSYEATLDHTLKWLDAVGLTEGHVLGHSRGGLLAASVVLARPQFAKSAVIVNSATLAPNPADPELQSGGFYAEIDRRTPPGPWTRESLRVEPEANSFSYDHITDEYISRYLAVSQLDNFKEAETKMKEGLNDNVFMPSLNRARAETLEMIDERGMPCRTLVIWSANDTSAPFAHVGLQLYERICARTLDVELHMFNRAGHYTYREHPAGFARVVEEYCLRPGVREHATVD